MEKLIIWQRLDGLNEYTRANRTNAHIGASMKRNNENLIIPYIQRDLRGKHFEKIDLDITWYEPTKRRDPDNIFFAIKFILDSLVKCGIIPNDSQKHIGEITQRVISPSKSPRIEVLLKEIEWYT